MFTYTLTEQVNHLGSTVTIEYTGFTHVITKRNLQGNRLIIAWYEGVPEYWIVESDEGIKQLQAFYYELIGMVPVFTVHQEVK
jgi:hypothetical protein